MADTLRIRREPLPYVDGRAFRDAMASMGSTVCIVATQHGDEREGRIVTSMFSLSLEPPAILVSIDKASALAARITEANGFSFAALAEDQRAIADAFVSRVGYAHRFDTGKWSTWRSGHPKLAGAVAAMDCTVIGTIETETHVLFAGGVVDVEIASARLPLMWQQRHYKSLVEPLCAESAC